MKALRLCITVAALMAAQGVLAAEGGGFYLAAGFGDADIDDSTFGLNVDDSDTGLHAILGFNLLPYVSLEAGYVDFGEFDANAPALGVRTQAELDGFMLGGRGQYEFADHWYLQGRFGVFLWDAEAEAVSAGNSIRVNEDGSEPYYGFGVRYDFDDHWGASADWTRYETDDLDVDYLSLSVVWSFDF